MSGFCHGVLDVFALLGYGTVLTFQDSVLVPSSVVQILRSYLSWNIGNKPTYAAQQPTRTRISIVLEFYVCNVHKPTFIYICQVNYV